MKRAVLAAVSLQAQEQVQEQAQRNGLALVKQKVDEMNGFQTISL